MFTRLSLGGMAFAAAIAFSLPQAQAAGAPTASELGPEATLTEPSGGFVGRLELSPERGPIGTPVAVHGEGLPANEELDLVWRTTKVRWKVEGAEYHGREYTPAGYRIATVKTDANGAFTASFKAPDDFGFYHDITVQQAGRTLTQAAFYINMMVAISPQSGPVGTPITVDVKGIGTKQLQNSWLLLYDNAYTGWMPSVRGNGSAHFTIPATGRPGNHVVEVLHGGFTFAYRNMQQSPQPNRPRFALNFQITEGKPVLPPPPEKQVQASVQRLPEAGELKVEPAFSHVGEPITVSGTGFEAGKNYTLNWSRVTGNRVSGSGWEETERVIAEATADTDGKLVYTFATPDDLGGSHTLRVAGPDGDVAGSVWIAPSALPLDVSKGPAGTPFTIHLKGVGWTETANIYAIDYDNGYIGYACGFNSQGDVVINMYATGDPGMHYITLYPAVYKGKEKWPNNFRLPQLTYKVDHPGEDLPRFEFAFEVTKAETN
ncbi:MAG: hypothetical protein LJE67_13875 [Salaquimonas sp.]|nr:hypothetical protein [Salaquimonas sp.]